MFAGDCDCMRVLLHAFEVRTRVHRDRVGILSTLLCPRHMRRSRAPRWEVFQIKVFQLHHTPNVALRISPQAKNCTPMRHRRYARAQSWLRRQAGCSSRASPGSRTNAEHVCLGPVCCETEPGGAAVSSSLPFRGFYPVRTLPGSRVEPLNKANLHPIRPWGVPESSFRHSGHELVPLRRMQDGTRDAGAGCAAACDTAARADLGVRLATRNICLSQPKQKHEFQSSRLRRQQYDRGRGPPY